MQPKPLEGLSSANRYAAEYPFFGLWPAYAHAMEGVQKWWQEAKSPCPYCGKPKKATSRRCWECRLKHQTDRIWNSTEANDGGYSKWAL